MKKNHLLTLAVVAGVCLSFPLVGQAQEGSAPATAPAKAHAKKHASKGHHKTKKGVPYRHAKAIEENTPAKSLSSRLSENELQIAQGVYTGIFPCELGAHVSVVADQNHSGFFSVHSGHRHYYMHPVESKTGAVRLEDNRAGAVWLQLGQKSMLMDTRKGERVADNCQTAKQVEFQHEVESHPNHQLLGSPAGATGDTDGDGDKH